MFPTDDLVEDLKEVRTRVNTLKMLADTDHKQLISLIEGINDSLLKYFNKRSFTEGRPVNKIDVDQNG